MKLELALMKLTESTNFD